MRLSGRVRKRKTGAKQREQGYVLLAILLVLTMVAIAAATAAPDLAMEIRRQREQELINRGTQYMRAIQHYYKKFGRYPARMEDLENTNGLRFLRKRYKDPVTGKDFRVLHYGEIPMGAISGMGAQGMAGGMMGGAAAAAMSGAFGQSPAAGPSIFAQQPGGPGMMGAPGGPQTGMQTGIMSGQTQGESSGSQGGIASSQLSGTVFGGGPIIGVASTSHKASIREFNKKNHYNDWFFVYDPGLDRGGLIRGPAQPPIPGTGGAVVGTPGAAGNQGPGGIAGPSATPSPSPFGGSPLQGPGAMIPAQPQEPPQQQ